MIIKSSYATSLAYAQECGYDIPTWTKEEQEKIDNFKLPDEEDLDPKRFGQLITPRLRGKAKIIKEYYKNHAERIRYLEIMNGNWS